MSPAAGSPLPSPEDRRKPGPAVGARPFVLGALAVGVAIAWPRLPAALELDAPADQFSASRAMEHIRAWADAPRPTGSDRHAEVVDAVEAALVATGMPVVRERGRGLTNLVGGTGEGGVWLVAHSDSVAEAPGAADDGLGLGVVVESVRALAQGGLAPDLHVLITDGEEAGLLGAKLHTRLGGEPDPAMTRRLVLNVEARGSGGPAFMFQVAGPEAPLISAFAEAGCAAQTSSLAATVYALLPNDTDFTVFRLAGWSGYDFALIGAPHRYHSPEDTPDNLDPRSVQQVGDCVVGLARQWLGRPLSSTPAPRAWLRVPGGTLVFPEWLVRLSALAILLFPRPTRDAWRGALAMVGAVVAAVIVGIGLLYAAMELRPDFWDRAAEMPGAEPWYIAAFVVGCALATLAAGGRRTEGWLLTTGVLGATLAALVPDVGYLFVPAIVAAAALQRHDAGRPRWALVAGVAALLGGLTTGPVFAAIYPALTTRALPVLAVVPLFLIGWALSRRR